MRVLGVVGGLVSVCFVKLLLAARKQFLGIPNPPNGSQPVAGGLLVGLMGWFVPEVLGVGYNFVGRRSTATCFWADGVAGRPEARGHRHLLRVRQRRRHFRAQLCSSAR